MTCRDCLYWKRDKGSDLGVCSCDILVPKSFVSETVSIAGRQRLMGEDENAGDCPTFLYKEN